MNLYIDYSWDLTNCEWIYSLVEHYYYKSLSTDISNLESSSFKVYPNPAVDYITIETGDSSQPVSVEMYSISGKLVLQKELTNSK